MELAGGCFEDVYITRIYKACKGFVKLFVFNNSIDPFFVFAVCLCLLFCFVLGVLFIQHFLRMKHKTYFKQQ